MLGPLWLAALASLHTLPTQVVSLTEHRSTREDVIYARRLCDTEDVFK